MIEMRAIYHLLETADPETQFNAVLIGEKLKKKLERIKGDYQEMTDFNGLKIHINPFLPDDLIIYGNEERMIAHGLIKNLGDK